MSTDDLDRTLKRLRQSAERISANLVELEVDPGRKLLEATALAGKSAAEWSTASAALTELWRRQALLESVLERAGKLHGWRHADELRSLLEGPSIELASSQVPLAERDLLGGSEIAQRCSPDELLVGMACSFDEVKDVICRIAGGWGELVPRLDAARRLVGEVRGLAAELGDTDRFEVESASKAMDALGPAITTDPLSASAGDVDRLVRSLEGLRDDLLSIAALKRGFEAKALEADRLSGQLRKVTEEARAAHDELLVKIAGSEAPPAPVVPGDVDDQLAQIGELAGRSAWREARSALDDWTTRTQGLLDDSQRVREANRAPIEARDQLRGLLEAYRAKARRLGLLEEPELEDTFARAQDPLYRAPTDLALAAQLVREYQHGLNRSPRTPEAMP